MNNFNNNNNNIGTMSFFDMIATHLAEPTVHHAFVILIGVMAYLFLVQRRIQRYSF